MTGLQFSQFENTARAVDMVLGDFNPQSNINTNMIPTSTTPSDQNETLDALRFSSTNVVPYTSKLEHQNRDIPQSYDQYIGPPFKPIHIREIYDHVVTPNDRRRLSDEQIQAIVQNPNKELLPQMNRLKVLSDLANEKQQKTSLKERFYNLSLRQIVENMVGSVGDVIDDIITYKWSGDPGGFEGIMQIFTKNDRLIYLGMIVMIFAFLVILIRETDATGLS